MTFATRDKGGSRVRYKCSTKPFKGERIKMETNVVVKQQYCAAVRKEAQLIETRVYPENDLLVMDSFRVKKQECALGLECSMDDHVHCVWAGAGNTDPFAEG